MKKIFLLIAILIAVPFSVMSKVQIDNSYQNHQTDKMQNAPSFSNDELIKINKSKINFPTTLGKFRLIDTVADALFNGYNNGSTSMTYEPLSGTLFLTQYDRVYDSIGTDRVMSGEVILYYSTDKGQNWNSKVIYYKLGDAAVNASISVLNPKKSTNINDLFINVYCSLFRYNTVSKKYEVAGALYLFNEGNGLDSFQDFTDSEPSNSAGAYKWSDCKTTTYNGPDLSYTYFYGKLSPNDGQQYGLYGFGSLVFNTEGFSNNYSIMPPEWGSQYWYTTDKLNSSYNAPIYVDYDQNGTLYAALSNIFSDNTQVRSLAISKSTDNGQTWSEFERIPQAVIDNYVQAQGIESAYSTYPYWSHGFVVTGVDEYTYIMSFRKVISSTAGIYENYITEFYKKNGDWKVREIAKLNGENWRCPYIIEDSSTVSGTILDGFDDSRRGYEIELSKTADGQNILLKYVDNRPELASLNEVMTLCGGNVQVDSTLTTDIWVTYRDVDDKNGWSSPANITDDLWMNHLTWIPDIIPSLSEVPIIEHVTTEYTNPANQRVINKYPYFVQNFIIQQAMPTMILYSTFDATKGENISNSTIQVPKGANGTTSVENQINTEINSFTIYPNPVTSNASLSYDIANNAYVKIEVFNSMGELVKTVRNYSLATPGISGLSFDTNNLSTGVYYVTLTANGKKVTKMMNVVR